MTKTPTISTFDALLCYNVYALNLAFGRFYQSAFGETGFTYPKFLVLKVLSEEGALSLSDLSARIGVEPNTLSPMVKKMSGFGLIDRMRDSQDERRVLLTLKPFGEAVLEEASEVVAAGWDELGLDEAAVAATNELLSNARKRLEVTSPKRIMKQPKRP